MTKKHEPVGPGVAKVVPEEEKAFEPQKQDPNAAAPGKPEPKPLGEGLRCLCCGNRDFVKDE